MKIELKTRLSVEKFLEFKFGGNWPLPVARSSRGFSPAYFLDFDFLGNPGNDWKEHFLLFKKRMSSRIHFEDFITAACGAIKATVPRAPLDRSDRFATETFPKSESRLEDTLNLSLFEGEKSGAMHDFLVEK
ncbi:hypothetical protein Y032_0124g1183 [Ancylostoma ceylanicum]|uniref:Uncharacterized protein n=1 Tax=Ancylostoma ceylanicum TaxID=53326 RepID=A0A016T965_9BILA|nr:hypothetical protein Y032_0124g1183 [Ancylostoma ceylanicum]